MKNLLIIWIVLQFFIIYFFNEFLVRYIQFYFVFTLIVSIIFFYLNAFGFIKFEWMNESKIKTIVLHNYLEVMDTEYNLVPINWETAKKITEKRGNNWRIPSKYEIEILYKNKKLIGGLDQKSYFFKSGFKNGATMNFKNGASEIGDSYTLSWIRLVRYHDKHIVYNQSLEEVLSLTRYIDV
jgi:hypothetical protein